MEVMFGNDDACPAEAVGQFYRIREFAVKSIKACGDTFPVSRQVKQRETHRYFQSCFEARSAPSRRARNFSQASCGWIRPPSPQSVPAITFSRPTMFAYWTILSAISSGCSRTFVAWL